MTKKKTDQAKQAKKTDIMPEDYVGKWHPPKDTRFNGERANRRGHGFWKKEDTPRYQLEKMMQLTMEDLRKIAMDRNQPLFSRKIADALANSNWNVIERMINQVYGMPKQTIDQTIINPPQPLLPKKTIHSESKKNEKKTEDNNA